MTHKELKQLAAACRQAGIKHYKDAEIEFTLSDDLPEPRRRRQKSAPKAKEESLTTPETDGWDSLSDEQKLFYSSTPMDTGEEIQ